MKEDSFKVYKIQDEDLEVEFDFLPIQNARETEIQESILAIEQQQACLSQRIDALNVDIERLTNNADGIDYTIAVASGVMAGMIDSFFIGEFNFEELKADSHKHINKFIEKYAKLRGYTGKGLKGAIAHLEDNFRVAQDNIWHGKNFSSTKLHHLEDLAHHPTLIGLFFSIVVVFFKVSTFVDKNGKWHFEYVGGDKKDLIKAWAPIVISGLLRWLVFLAESKCKNEGKEIPKPIHNIIVLLSQAPAIIKVLKVADNWCGHLVSDMGGSKNTAGGGMGIPGIFISLMKEISSLPFIKNTQLPQIVSYLYSKKKWDLRSEMAIVEYGVKQSIPIIFNEILVRTFYFVRHLVAEYKKESNWGSVNWHNTIPFNNRTINRMLTISSGTFVAADLADAAIRSAINNGLPNNPKFWTDMLLRVNFVGIGRFAIAIYSDVKMGMERKEQIRERLSIQNKYLMYENAKIYYMQEGTWMAAKDAAEAMLHLEETANKCICLYITKFSNLCSEWDNLPFTNVKNNDPQTFDDLSTIYNNTF